MELKDLTPEQQEKFNACKTAEEILALVREEGIELSEDQLKDISGGWPSGGTSIYCPQCGKRYARTNHSGTVNQTYICPSGHEWS